MFQFPPLLNHFPFKMVWLKVCERELYVVLVEVNSNHSKDPVWKSTLTQKIHKKFVYYVKIRWLNSNTQLNKCLIRIESHSCIFFSRLLYPNPNLTKKNLSKAEHFVERYKKQSALVSVCSPYIYRRFAINVALAQRW